MNSADSNRAVIVVRDAGDEDLDTVRTLFVEYQRMLGVDLCFQGFDTELESLPGGYAPPAGALLLATVDGAAAGCVGLRRLDAARCEMKRLYLRDDFRGHGLGRRLAVEVIERARHVGYHGMVLDTLERLTAAITLYRSLGFREIPGYYDNPLHGVSYWKLDLRA